MHYHNEERVTEIIGESLEEYLTYRALYGAYLKQYSSDKKGKRIIEEIKSSIQTSKELTELVVFLDFLAEVRFEVTTLPHELDAKKNQRPATWHAASSIEDKLKPIADRRTTKVWNKLTKFSVLDDEFLDAVDARANRHYAYVTGKNSYELLKSKVGIYVDEKRRLLESERDRKISDIAKTYSVMLPTRKSEKLFRVYDPELTRDREHPQYQFTDFVNACLTVSKRRSAKEYSEDLDKIEYMRYHKTFNEDLLYLVSYQLRGEESSNVQKYGFDFIDLHIPDEIKEIEKQIFKYQKAIDTLNILKKIYKDHFYKFEKDYHFEKAINDDIKYYEGRITQLEDQIERLQEKYQKELKERIAASEAKRAKEAEKSLKVLGLGGPKDKTDAKDKEKNDSDDKKDKHEDDPIFDYPKIFEEAFKNLDGLSAQELQKMKTNLSSFYKQSSKDDKNNSAIFNYEELFGTMTDEDKKEYERYKTMRNELDNLIMNKSNYINEKVFEEEVVARMQKYNLGITYEEIIRNLETYRNSLKVCQSMNYIVMSVMLEYTDQDQMLILENNRLTSFENSVKERCTLILNHGNIPTELREELTYYRDRLNALEREFKLTLQNQRLMYMPAYQKVIEEIRTKYLINTSVLNEIKQAPTDTDGHKR